SSRLIGQPGVRLLPAAAAQVPPFTTRMANPSSANRVRSPGVWPRSENLLRDLSMDTRPQIALYANGRPPPAVSVHHHWDSMPSPATTTAVASETKLSIGFINWAHALDHYVMLIFPTVVIGLEIVYGRSYAELIALGTPAFIAFGVFSLPAGWL